MGARGAQRPTTAAPGPRSTREGVAKLAGTCRELDVRIRAFADRREEREMASLQRGENAMALANKGAPSRGRRGHWPSPAVAP